MHYPACAAACATAIGLRNQPTHNSFEYIQTAIIRLFRNTDYRIINVCS